MKESERIQMAIDDLNAGSPIKTDLRLVAFGLFFIAKQLAITNEIRTKELYGEVKG